MLFLQIIYTNFPCLKTDMTVFCFPYLNISYNYIFKLPIPEVIAKPHIAYYISNKTYCGYYFVGINRFAFVFVCRDGYSVTFLTI